MMSYLSLGPETILTLVVTFICAYWYLRTIDSRRYPPGPSPWPLLGHLPYLFGKKRLEFTKSVADRYGAVTTIWVGTQPAILLNTPESVKDAYVNQADHFNARPFTYVIQKILDGKRSGVLFNVGESHKAMRRVTLVALHDFGLGKQSLEEKVRDEVQAVTDELLKRQGQPISDFRRIIQLAIANVIISICFGNRFSYHEEEFTTIMSNIDAFFTTSPAFEPESIYPILRYLPIKTASQTITRSQNSIKDYIRKQIKSHRTTFDPANIRDFVDLYLNAEKEKDEYFNVDNLFRVIMDLFIAGTETTTTTLAWTFLYIIKNPSIQEKAREEINAVLGENSSPTLKDRPKLVYIDAIIHEVLRIAAVAPLGAARFLERSVTVGGLELPSGSFVFPNIYNIHMNKSYWKDPEVFRPERWIDDKGLLVKHDYYLPFLIGRRVCLGESLAKTELFLVLVILLQRFRFSVPAGQASPSLQALVNSTRAPIPYEVCAIPIK